jgi:exopolysaccharide biosynthesis polyprenyl glycosylphosphotransferase
LRNGLETASRDFQAEATFAFAAAPTRRVVTRELVTAYVQVSDCTMVLLVMMLWFGSVRRPGTIELWLVEMTLALCVAVLSHCVFRCFRLYDFTILTLRREVLVRILAAGIVLAGTLMAPLLMYQDLTAVRMRDACYLVGAGLAGLAIVRLSFAWTISNMQQTGNIGRRIYIIADGSTAAASLRLTLERSGENHIVGAWAMAEHFPVEEALKGALGFLRINSVDAVMLHLPTSDPARILEVACALRNLPHKVLLAHFLDGYDRIVWNQGVQLEAQVKTVLIKISDRPLAGWRWVVKDIQDWTIALLLLVIVAPLMLLIMGAIKLTDRGPVFFRQERLGYGGKPFDIIKFRSMRVPNEQPNVGLKLATRGDPRLFPVGRFLRKTSMDELPQLLNVLKGEMWVVGPRPHSPLAEAGGKAYANAVKEYLARYRIKPGITGWAQVRGCRGPTQTVEQLSRRVEHDLYYIENWSVFFDAKILLRTLTCVFGHENAF